MTTTSINEPIIELHDVDYRLDNGRYLITQLSFAIQTGETIVLLGRSGSGKTTTLKLINRLLTATKGQINVLGKEIEQWELTTLRRKIGYVIQQGGLFPHYTVARNVALVPELEGWQQDSIDLRVNELLELVGLPANEFRDRYPRQLSGGQQQRVGLARALAADPPILLLDEPFGALDAILRRQLQKDFHNLIKKLNKTVLFVTHDLKEALFLASRIGLMVNGKMIALDIPNNFLANKHQEIRAFVECLDDLS